jgi:hypothetical protein
MDIDLETPRLIQHSTRTRLPCEEVSDAGTEETIKRDQRTSGDVSELGDRLEAVLANPDRYTIEDYAGLLEQLHAELRLVRPSALDGRSSRDPLVASDGDDLAALFEHDLHATPLSENDIDTLVHSLQPWSLQTH